MATNDVIRAGNIGIGVNKIQGYLNVFQSRGIITSRVTQDGVFGSDTRTAVMQFQRAVSLPADGIVGERTWDAMMLKLRQLRVYPNIPVASPSYYLGMGQSGLSVYKMQQYLNAYAERNVCLKKITVDGQYGSATQQSVTQYQYLNNLTMDGRIGATTWDFLVRDYLQNV